MLDLGNRPVDEQRSVGTIDPAMWPDRLVNVAAYLCDPVAVHGPGDLYVQKTTVERLARGCGFAIGKLYVDSGRSHRSDAIGCALARLLADAGRGRVHLVSVDGLHRFSSDGHIAELVRRRFEDLGVGLLLGALATGLPTPNEGRTEALDGGLL